MPKLSASELQEVQQLLQDYQDAQPGIAALRQNEGDFDAALERLVAEEAGTADFGVDRQRLREVFVQNLRKELCGDDSFRTQVEEYNKKPGKAEALAGLIVYVIDVVALPINPAIAVVVVLWVLKLGIRTFCDYTEPVSE